MSSRARQNQSRAIARKKAAASSKSPMYRTPRVTGSGAYRRKAAPRSRNMLPSGLGSMLGGAAGTFLGGPLGGVVGSGLGHLAQGLIKHITGFGDYSVRVNSLMGDGFSPPELINLSKNSVCLRHREYIGDISASEAFSVQGYDINPGMQATFPWLSGVANNFEEYMFTGMIFEFKTLSADYTTASSAALGYVAMATQYNSLLPDFEDKVHLENYEFSNSAKPSETFVHPIECARGLNPVSQLYVRTGPVPQNADQRLYDLGRFQIATGGNTGTGILGELWCTYEVCLYKPRFVENDNLTLAGQWTLAGVTLNAPLGASPATPAVGNTLELSIDGLAMVFPATLTSGQFLVSYYVLGSAATINDPTVTALSNCTKKSIWGSTPTPQITIPANGVSSVAYTCSVLLEVTGPSATLLFSDDGVIPTSVTFASLWVAQVNDAIDP